MAARAPECQSECGHFGLSGSRPQKYPIAFRDQTKPLPVRAQFPRRPAATNSRPPQPVVGRADSGTPFDLPTTMCRRPRTTISRPWDNRLQFECSLGSKLRVPATGRAAPTQRTDPPPPRSVLLCAPTRQPLLPCVRAALPRPRCSGKAGLGWRTAYRATVYPIERPMSGGFDHPGKIVAHIVSMHTPIPSYS